MSLRSKKGFEVSLDAISIGYDEQNGEYEIEITDATLLRLDIKSQLIRIKIPSNKIKQIHDDDSKTNHHNPPHMLGHMDDDEPSDETDQEQEEEETKDHNQTQESEHFIPKDQDEIIEMYEHDDEDTKNDDIKDLNDTNDAINTVHITQTVSIQNNGHKDDVNIPQTQDAQCKGIKEKEDTMTAHIAEVAITVTEQDTTAKRTSAKQDDDVDEYASDDNDHFQDDEDDNERCIKIEHNLRDPYLDELLTQQINAALQLEPENKTQLQLKEEQISKENKNDWRWALKMDNVDTEWKKYAPIINLQNISSVTKSLKNITTETFSYVVGQKQHRCLLDINECECVQRLIFIMKYYSFWMKFKTETRQKKQVNASQYAQSISDFFDSLRAYNRCKLLRDYLHIRHYHFNDDKLIAYIHRSQIPDCNDSHKMCKCITRNHENKELYKNMNNRERRARYWIDNDRDMKAESVEEMLEINLQKLLDVIHSSFLHNAISNGTKFVTSVHIEAQIQTQNQQQRVRISSLSSLSSNQLSNKAMIIDAPFYEFGMKFDFHRKHKVNNYCAPKYPDLKTELLNNPIHKLSRNDFTSIYILAQEYMSCDEGCKYMYTKRSVCGIQKGSKISIEHVLVILTRCNYAEIERKFNMNAWMKKNRKENSKELIMDECGSIANWSKLLVEAMMCFGDILDDSQYIYHGINYKITFRDVSGIQFNIAISCTTQYSVARNFANEYTDGICLKLGKMTLTKDVNYMFDISDFSDYPNEREVLIFGGKLSFVDIVYDSLSHHDYVLSLQLYQQIIKGRFFTTRNDYHNKKHQRRIVKMIENMMDKNCKTDYASNDLVKIDLDLGLNYIDPYIQSLFETITKNVLKKTIWINKESDTLLPELKTVFINDFIPFLNKKPFDIDSKYAHVDTWIVSKKHLLMTDRENPLKSAPFDHVEILNNDDMDTTDDDAMDDNKITVTNNKQVMSLKEFNKQIKDPTDLKITFAFRCYTKYDAVKKEDMFKGEFMITHFPTQIDSVKMLGGLWFPQIPLCKWDWCSFSNKKKSKGSSLFPIAHISDDEEFKIKICYQVKEVVQKQSLP